MSVPPPVPAVFSSELLDADDCDGLVVERSGQVPVCLIEGASGVAERPVHDVDGPVVEAGQGSCVEIAPPDQLTAPSENTSVKAPASGPHALISCMPETPKLALSGTAMPRPPTFDGPGEHSARVFRPPRS